MIDTMLRVLLRIAMGLVFSRYETHRTRRERRQRKLSQRARRCVRRED